MLHHVIILAARGLSWIENPFFVYVYGSEFLQFSCRY